MNFTPDLEESLVVCSKNPSALAYFYVDIVGLQRNSIGTRDSALLISQVSSRQLRICSHSGQPSESSHFRLLCTTSDLIDFYVFLSLKHANTTPKWITHGQEMTFIDPDGNVVSMKADDETASRRDPVQTLVFIPRVRPSITVMMLLRCATAQINLGPKSLENIVVEVMAEYYFLQQEFEIFLKLIIERIRYPTSDSYVRHAAKALSKSIQLALLMESYAWFKGYELRAERLRREGRFGTYPNRLVYEQELLDTGNCPYCSGGDRKKLKKIFSTPGDADSFNRRMIVSHGHSKQRAYACPQGFGWHLATEVDRNRAN